jgi:hypothetical protein
MCYSTDSRLKLIIYSILLVCAVHPIELKAQNAYYDAQSLTTLLESPSISYASYDLLKGLLRKYRLLDSSHFVGVDALDNVSAAGATIALKDLIPQNSSNTFFNNSTIIIHIQNPPPTGDRLALDRASASASLDRMMAGQPSSSTSGSLTAMIIEGVGKFLADRTKEELTIAFFQKFKTFLNTNPEIGTLFPTTIKFLNNILSTNSSNMLSTLRAAFVSDIKNILGDIAAIATLDPTSSCSLCTSQNRKNKCVTRLTHIQSIFKTDFGRLLVAGLIIADGAINQKNPADILSAVSNNKDVGGLNSDVSNSLKLLDIFSKALKSNDPTEIWMPVSNITGMAGNLTLRNCFFGFVYGQLDSLKITIGNQRVTTFLTLNNVGGAQTYITNLITAANTLATSFHALINASHTASDTNTQSVLNNSKTFVAALSQFLSQSMKYTTINSGLPMPPAIVVNILNYTDSALSVVENILDKNYYAAFLSLDMLVQNITGVSANAFTPAGNVKDKYQIINDSSHNQTNTAYKSNKSVTKKIKELSKSSVPGARDSANKLSNLYDNGPDLVLDRKTFISNLLRYGNFLSDVVTASDVDGVENAIEAMALPPGSSSIKKNTNVSIAVQSYVGIGMSHNPGGSPYFQNFGVSAPVGVSFNFGLRSWFCPKFFTKPNPVEASTWGSLSVFIPLVDLGAVVSYEFTNPSSQPSNTTNVTWANIFAPGVNLVYGIPGVPLSVGFGPEYQSALKTLSKTGTTLNQNPGLRWNVFLAVDIPVVNFYVSKN